MSGLRGIVPTVRLLCELAMIAAVAYWGFEAADGAAAWPLGLGAPALAVAIWGAFVARRLRHLAAQRRNGGRRVSDVPVTGRYGSTVA